ncbi:MAG TPA: AI-2E family transporter [Candidatus Limnocylindrales bacterium]
MEAPTEQVEAPSVAATRLAGPPAAGQSAPPAGFGPLSRRVVLVAIAAAIFGFVLYLGSSAVGPFVLGLVLAYLLDMPVERMARIGFPRWLSVLIVYAIVLVAIVEFGMLTLRPLADQLASFIKEFPTFTAQVSDMYAHLDLSPSVRQAIDKWLAELGSGIAGLDPSALLPVVSGIAGIVGAIFGYVLIPVWIFYLIKDRPALAAAAERSIPAGWWPDVSAVTSLVLRVFGQWLRGQVVLGVTVGLLTFAGLALLSSAVDPIFGRFAVLLSVIAGVLELLPIIGPIIAAIPAVLLALTAGLDVGIAAVILYTVIQQVENYFLVPKVQGDAVDMHPSAVMFALVIGGAIAGLLGAILALPITAAARDVFRYLFHRLSDPPASPDEAVRRILAHPTIVTPVAETNTAPPGGPGPAEPAPA